MPSSARSQRVRVRCAAKPGQLGLRQPDPVVEAGCEVPALRRLSPGLLHLGESRLDTSLGRGPLVVGHLGLDAGHQREDAHHHGVERERRERRGKLTSVAAAAGELEPQPDLEDRRHRLRISDVGRHRLRHPEVLGRLVVPPLEHVMEGRARVEVLGEHAAPGGEPELPDHVLGLAPPAQAEEHHGSLEAQPVDRWGGGPDARGVVQAGSRGLVGLVETIHRSRQRRREVDVAAHDLRGRRRLDADIRRLAEQRQSLVGLVHHAQRRAQRVERAAQLDRRVDLPRDVDGLPARWHGLRVAPEQHQQPAPPAEGLGTLSAGAVGEKPNGVVGGVEGLVAESVQPEALAQLAPQSADRERVDVFVELGDRPAQVHDRGAQVGGVARAVSGAA